MRLTFIFIIRVLKRSIKIFLCLKSFYSFLRMMVAKKSEELIHACYVSTLKVWKESSQDRLLGLSLLLNSSISDVPVSEDLLGGVDEKAVVCYRDRGALLGGEAIEDIGSKNPSDIHGSGLALVHKLGEEVVESDLDKFLPCSGLRL